MSALPMSLSTINNSHLPLTATLNLNFESFSRKVEDDCRVLSSIRNDLFDIKTFEEFKYSRNNLIQLLLDQENDLRQMNIYLKSLNHQRKDLEEVNSICEKKKEKLELKVLQLEAELIESQSKSNDYLRQVTYLTSSNNNKEVFINELKERLESYEKRVNDYQGMLERSEENVRLLESKVELVKGENLILKSAATLNSYSDMNLNSTNYNYDYQVQNQSRSKSPKANMNQSYHSNYSSNYNYKYHYSDGGLVKRKVDDDYKESEVPEKQEEKYNIDVQGDNKNAIYSKTPQDKPSRIYNLVLKIFSSKSLTQHLKNKLGDDFHNKLTTQDVDSEFIENVEKEIEDFDQNQENTQIDKEKPQNYPNHEYSSSKDLPLHNSTNPYVNLERSSHNRKQFNQYTKQFPDYFDPSIQRGGRSSILNNQTKSKSRTSSKNKTDYKGRVDFSPESKVYNYRELPHGWTSTKEYFISHPQTKIDRLPEKITSKPF